MQREWLNARRVEAEEKLYRTLRDRYEIVVEAAPSKARSMPKRSDETPRRSSSGSWARCSHTRRTRTKSGPAIWKCARRRADTYNLLFKIPARGDDLRLAIYLKLPEGTSDVTPPQARFIGGAYIERRTVRRSGGLAGQAIALDGLSATSTDMLVRIESLGGATQTERLSPTKTIVRRPGRAGFLRKLPGRICGSGVEHILFGFDHLLFVLVLVILVRDWRRVALTVTAFTVAHSITLAAATLGFVNVPGRPVEAAIALSIVLVAVEIVNARRGMPSLTARWPWLVAFCFRPPARPRLCRRARRSGIAATRDPDRAAVLQSRRGDRATGLRGCDPGDRRTGCAAPWRFASRLRPIQRTADWLDVTAAYAIGALAAYWLIERTAAFFA